MKHDAGDAADELRKTSRVILDASGIQRAVTRIAHEILERNSDPDSIAVVGIVSGGVPIAEMLVSQLREITGADIRLGSLDVTLYRDDVIGRGKRPLPKRTQMPFSVMGLRVVLVDDTMTTGGSTLKAGQRVCEEWGAEIVAAFCIVGRGEGARETFEAEGIPYHDLVTIDDLRG